MIESGDIDFLEGAFESLQDNREYLQPSDYVEQVRYMSKDLTPKPGYYDFDYTPYLKEPLNHLSPLSNKQEIVIMKPVQIGGTVGILENAIAYNIGCVPKPQIFISADKELAEMGMELRVEKMLDSCGLRDKITSQSNAKKTRKTGDTTNKKEYPGGFLVALGARNPGKLRSISVPIVLIDEFDGFPDRLGNEGDPGSLVINRTNAFASTRKILYLSTPLITQTSKIYKKYLEGDQRHFYVPCKNCGEYIVLKWHLNESQTQTGDQAGIIYEMTEGGRLIPQSVKYKCQSCGKEMKNHDKAIILRDGYWEATEAPQNEKIVSYWLNSLYSPVGMYSWTNMTYDWLKAWDTARDRVKDIEEYKTFRNTKQGLPFEEQGESPKFERVIMHRRSYATNKLSNERAREETGDNIFFLTCSCDVQGDKIVADIKAFCKGGVNYTVDYRELYGKTSDFDDQCWRELEKIIENEIWHDENRAEYKIIITVIDSGYQTENVYRFCSQYSSGVYPIKGTDYIKGNVTFRLMSKNVLEKAGCLCYELNTGKLKDRLAKCFNREWNIGEMQPEWRPNFPEDLADKFFSMYEAESKVAEYDKRTNKFIRFIWKKTNIQAENEAFDTHCYAFAAVEIIADYVCREDLQLDFVEWDKFWEYAGEKYGYNNA